MGTSSVTWEEALRSFLHLKAIRAVKTVRFYEVQLKSIIRWANAHQVALDRFGKRHLDEYLGDRLDRGTSRTTLHHDALCAKVFLKWCSRNDILSHSLLADYEVRSAPKTEKYMPSEEDMQKLLQGIVDYWNPERHPDIHSVKPSRRTFHRERNYAIILMLLDSAARIGEILSLRMENYDAEERKFIVIESKGREPRAIPVSNDCAEAVGLWLVVRKRVMRDVPKSADEGGLFISETSTRIDERVFLRTLGKFVEFAGVSDRITLHSLRRYSLNRLAKHNLLMAQTIAGHKETKTTPCVP